MYTINLCTPAETGGPDTISTEAGIRMGTTFRKDYKVPSHLIDSVHLEFDLDPDSSSVTSTMDVRPNPETDDKEK